MRRILIFIGLKLWEIGKVFFFIAIGLLSLGVLGFLLEKSKIFQYIMIGIFCLIVLSGISFLLIDELKDWIKSNWEKAGKIANEKKTKI